MDEIIIKDPSKAQIRQWEKEVQAAEEIEDMDEEIPGILRYVIWRGHTYVGNALKYGHDDILELLEGLDGFPGNPYKLTEEELQQLGVSWGYAIAQDGEIINIADGYGSIDDEIAIYTPAQRAIKNTKVSSTDIMNRSILQNPNTQGD